MHETRADLDTVGALLGASHLQLNADNTQGNSRGGPGTGGFHCGSLRATRFVCRNIFKDSTSSVTTLQSMMIAKLSKQRF